MDTPNGAGGHSPNRVMIRPFDLRDITLIRRLMERGTPLFTEAEDEQALGAQLSRDSALFQYAEITWNILAARIRFRARSRSCPAPQVSRKTRK